MASDGALLTAKFEDGRLELAAGGSWTAPHAAELETLVDRVSQDAAGPRAVSIDMRGVREFDTFGAWLLERLTRQWRSASGSPSVVGMPEHDRTLLKEMSGVNLRAGRSSRQGERPRFRACRAGPGRAPASAAT